MFQQLTPHTAVVAWHAVCCSVKAYHVQAVAAGIPALTTSDVPYVSDADPTLLLSPFMLSAAV
jgi:hypothetical protein